MPGIKSIVYQPEGKAYRYPMGGFIRGPVETAELVAGHGISGDQNAGREKTRHLNILTSDWLEQAEAAGYRTAPGALGEQIVPAGLMLTDLKPEDRLALCKNTVIELTSARTGCLRLDAAQGKTSTPEIKKAPGFMARVITGGKIHVGDEVHLVDTASAI